MLSLYRKGNVNLNKVFWGKKFFLFVSRRTKLVAAFSALRQREEGWPLGRPHGQARWGLEAYPSSPGLYIKSFLHP